MYPGNMKMVQLIVLLLSGLLLVSVSGDVCIYQECECDGNSVSCIGRGLMTVPQKVAAVNTHYDSLALAMNGITTIPAGNLPSNLKEIDLVDNPIINIEDTAFDGSANTLEILTFSSALFSRIPDAFTHLKALETLTILDTTIDDWNEEAMKNIGRTVTSLDLENVGMTTWPTWIQYFSNLTELTLAHGSISSILDDTFDNVTNSLQILSLYENSLTTIPKALSKLKALKQLYLHNNNIIDLTWLPQESNLTSLYLTNNQISNAKLLSQALRHYGDSLNDFNIHVNHLTALPNCSFLKQIAHLDFSYNKISDPFSGSVSPLLLSFDLSYNSLPAIPLLMRSLQNVTDLIILNNAIKEIHGTDFPPSTKRAVLEYNLISALTDSSFPESSHIESVDLNNNPLEIISINAFANLHLLTELYLQNTKLTRLPLALRALSSLSVIYMTGSTDLVCTCMEKDLGNLFLSMSPVSVFGNCGQMSIYDFFSKLSPDCPSDQDIQA